MPLYLHSYSREQESDQLSRINICTCVNAGGVLWYKAMLPGQ